MKNRRLVIVAILLISVLCLGVAFAALVDDLSVGGALAVDKKIANDDFNADVHFEDITVKSVPTKANQTAVDNIEVAVEDDANGHEDDSISINIPAGVLNFTNDTVVVTAYIANESDEFNAEIAIEGANADSKGLCDVSCVVDSTVEKEDRNLVTITIKLKETVTSDTPISGEFNFTLTATSVKP